MRDVRVIYINLYRSGYFHRKGKPHTLNMHGGDCYATEADAKRAIFPQSHYVATVPIMVAADVELFEPNSVNSIPQPIQHNNVDSVPRAGMSSRALFNNSGI